MSTSQEGVKIIGFKNVETLLRGSLHQCSVCVIGPIRQLYTCGHKASKQQIPVQAHAMTWNDDPTPEPLVSITDS